MSELDYYCLWLGRITAVSVLAYCVYWVALVSKDAFRDARTAWSLLREDGRCIPFLILFSPIVFTFQVFEQIQARRGGYTTRLTKMKHS
jgi:hypothetical protein